MTQGEPLQVGQRAWWHHVCSNYGHVEYILVTVRKIGKRITVEAPLKRGGTKLVCVSRERLHAGAVGEIRRASDE